MRTPHPAQPSHPARHHPRPVFFAAVLTILLALSAVLARSPGAHPIDEVQSQALIHLDSADAATFEATVFLAKGHVQKYQELLSQLGLPPEQDRDALAMSVVHAFGFGDCTTRLGAPGQRHLEKAGGEWIGLRYVVQCPGPQSNLTFQRLQYRRERTRTTLLWTIAIAGREEIQALVPPHIESMTLSLSDGNVVRADRGIKQRPARDSVAGSSPTDRSPLADFPSAGAEYRSMPPGPVLSAWFQEGALHLIGGPDHLLFLLTLVIAGRGLRGLTIGVSSFSLGHMAAMGTALAMHWNAPEWLDILIGLTIAASAWQGRHREGLPHLRVAGTSAIFGLIHGLGFGAGLQALVGGVDQVWWPLLAFGLGLDVVQMVWVVLAALIWAFLLGRSERRGIDRQGPHSLAAHLLVAAGLATAIYATVGWLSGNSPY